MVRLAPVVLALTLGMLLALGGGVTSADPNWSISLAVQQASDTSGGHSFTVGCAVDALNARSTGNAPDPYDIRMAPLPAGCVTIMEAQGSARWIQDYHALDSTSMHEWSSIHVLAKGIQAPINLTVECKFGSGEMSPPAGMRFTLLESDPVTGQVVSHALTDGSSISFAVAPCSTERVVRILTLRAIGSSGMNALSASGTSTATSPLKKAIAEASARMAAEAKERMAVLGTPIRISSADALASQDARAGTPGKVSVQSAITSPVGLIKNRQWNLVSVPATPLDGNPLTIFQGFNVANSSLQYWNNASPNGGYISYGMSWQGPITPGVPYWLLPVEAEGSGPWNVSFDGYPTTPGFGIQIPDHPEAPYWIMFANPLETEVPCADVRFKNDTDFLKWADACNAGLVESSAMGFDNEANNYFSAGPPPFLVNRSTLQPWYGYWLLVRRTGTTGIYFMPGPPAVTALGSNAKNIIEWPAVEGAQGYRIYASSTETGSYTRIGEITNLSGSIIDYVDGPVVNGQTRWYKVSSLCLSKDETPVWLEGDLSAAVSATATEAAPTVSIDSATDDGNGLLTLQCSGSWQGDDPVYSLTVDDETLWVFEQSEIGRILYDTAQLPNGCHQIKISALAPNGEVGVDIRTINLQNTISEFSVPDEMNGQQPVSAKFTQATAWTLICQQGGQYLYSTSGTGDSMNVFWDASSTWGEFEVTVTAGGKTRTTKSSRSGGSNPHAPYIWAAYYPNDPLQGNVSWFRKNWEEAIDVLRRYGYSPYAQQITSDSEWVYTVRDFALNDPSAPADIFYFAGHGSYWMNRPMSRLCLWQTAFCGKMPNSPLADGAGLSAFKDISVANTVDYRSIGPTLGNSCSWDSTGRVVKSSFNRRLKFVYIDACNSGNSIMCLAFGIPKGRYPGLGRAYIGYVGKVRNDDAYLFCKAFWQSWQQSGVTLARAATDAYWAAGRRVKYVLHGDPNMTLP